MRYLYYSLLMLLLFWSCQDLAQLDTIEDVTYDAVFAFPLLNSSITLEDALTKLDNPEEIRVAPDGLLTVVYNSSLVTQESLDILRDLSSTLPLMIPILSDSVVLPFSLPGQVEIDQIWFDAGTLSFSFQHSHPDPIDVTIRMPQLVQDGQPLTYQLTVPEYSGSGPLPVGNNENALTDLEQVRIIPENNQVTFEYDAVAPDGTPVNLTNFFLSINAPSISYAEGFLGQRVYEGGSDEVDIDFFDFSYTDGQVLFSEPVITLFVENSYGIPTRAIVNDFHVTTTNGNILPVTGDLIRSGLDFPYPEPDQVGMVSLDSFVFTKDNSNVGEVLSLNPRSIAYDIDILTHPEGGTGQSGFVRNDNYYSVRMQVDLPMIGNILRFAVRDTVALSIGDLQEIEEAEIKIIADNDIPVDADLQLYFLDDSGVLLDSLFLADQQRLQAALMTPDQSGTITQTTEVIVPISAERFEVVKEVASAILTINLSTDRNRDQPVRIFQNQQIGIRAGMKAQVKSK